MFNLFCGTAMLSFTTLESFTAPGGLGECIERCAANSDCTGAQLIRATKRCSIYKDGSGNLISSLSDVAYLASRG
jgi:hypothetical protein